MESNRILLHFIVPSAPTDIMLVQLSPTMLVCKWQPPATMNGELTHYVLHIRKTVSGPWETECNITLARQPAYTFGRLPPYALIVVEVAAVAKLDVDGNGGGMGPFSPEVSTRLPEAGRHFLHKTTSKKSDRCISRFFY